MLSNGIDPSDVTVSRRIDTSKSPAAVTFDILFARRDIIDISKFIALLDGEGVTVTGGEQQLDYNILQGDLQRGCWTQTTGTLGGPPLANKSYSYEVKGTNFSASIKYTKASHNRKIDLLTVSHSPPLQQDKTSGFVIYAKQISDIQGRTVLEKCDKIMAVCLANIQREQQAKFDNFMTGFVSAPAE